MSKNYEIRKKETSKDNIKNPQEVHEEIIPQLGSSLLLCGKSGSGKSTLLASLINDDDGRFYTGKFDKMFLFSPTAEGDDIQKQYGVPTNHVFTDLSEAPELLAIIHKSQKEKIKLKGADKSPQYAIIFDDVIGDTKFMNSKEFIQCFYQTRHVNCTTFICTQHFKRVPRICRMQANFICFFRGGRNEVDMIAEEFSPPGLHKNDMMQIIDKATSEPFSFFTINMKVDWEKRFRKNLHPVLNVHAYLEDKSGHLYDEDGDFDTLKETKENGISSTRKQSEMESPGRSWKKQRAGGRVNERFIGK